MHYISMHYIFFFFFNDTATTEIYTLSLHDALPISAPSSEAMMARVASSFRRSAFSPAYSRSAATKAGGRLASRRAGSDQYSTGWKAWISRSRSTIDRKSVG